jgi:hypothetical protein
MLGRYLYFRRYFDEFVVISRYTQDAAQRVGDREAEARAWNDLGLALRSADHADEAITALTRARELSKAVGDRNGEAYAWNYLGSALRVADRLRSPSTFSARPARSSGSCTTAMVRPTSGTTWASP